MAEPNKYASITFDDLMPAQPSVQAPSSPAGSPPSTLPGQPASSSRFRDVRFGDLMPNDPTNDPMMNMPAGEPKELATWGDAFSSGIKTAPERWQQAGQGMKLFGAAAGSLDLSLSDPVASEMGDVVKLAEELKSNPQDEGTRLAIRALGGNPDLLISDNWEEAGGERLRMWNNLRTQRLTTSNIWQESKAEYKRLQDQIQAQRPDFDNAEFGSSKAFVDAVMTASVDMLPAIVASYVAGPQVGASVIGGQVLGQTMGDSIVNHNLTPEQATLRTVAFTAAEYAPEIMSLKVFTEAGGTVMKKILKAAGAEGLQEMFTEAVQSGLDWGTGLEDMTLGEYLQTIGYSGAVGATVGGLLRTPGAIIEGETPVSRETPPGQPAQDNRPAPKPTTQRTARPGETRPVEPQPAPARPMPDLDVEPTFEELMAQGEQAAPATEDAAGPQPPQATPAQPAQKPAPAVDFSDLTPQGPEPGQTLPPGAPVLPGKGGGRDDKDEATTANETIQRLLQEASERMAERDGMQDAARLMSEAREAQVSAAERLMAAGKPVAFRQGEMVTVITPSARTPGKLQATTFNATGALGDMTLNGMQDLASIGVPTRAQFLPAAEAEALLRQYGEAEGRYQQAKQQQPRTEPLTLPESRRRDDTQTSLTGERVVLQNRDRSSPASIEQMRQIASNPDYSRVGFSRDFLSGAPVVEPGASIPANQLGRRDRITTATGRKVPIQYAVVEADQLLPSHDANGNPLPDYATGKDGVSRVIAGNGRAAGLQQAWRAGTTGEYLDEMAFDADFHGIDSGVILGMNNPVLIRVMPQEEITADIADQTNTTGTAALSPAEQARNDARRVDVGSIALDEDGEVTRQAAEQFIAAMPQAEKAGLLDNKAPNKAAYDRLSNMIFATAYESDELLRLYAESADPEIRTILNGLKIAAPKMARLKDAGQYDIRALAVEAAEAAVSAKRANIKLADYVKQDDMARNPAVMPLLQMMADNIRSAKKIGEMLSNLADLFYAESARPDQDMLGDTMKRSPRGLLEDFYGNEIDDQDAGAAGQQGRPEPADQGDAGPAADLDRPPSFEGNRQPDAAQPTQEEVTPPEEFDLAAQTPDDLRAKDEREASAEDAEVRAQIDRERELFGLDRQEGNVTGTGQQSAASQGGLFGGEFTTRGDRKQELDEKAHQAATSPKNDLPEPTDAQKEAGNYQKGHITLHGLDITIENPRGSKRSGTDPDGNAWEVTMADHYGYIKRTEGADGDHVDVYIGPNPESETAFIVFQIDQKTGKFDEHKVMLGYDSKQDAQAGYLANYTRGWQMGEMSELDIATFKEWLASDAPTRSRRPGTAPEHLGNIGKPLDPKNKFSPVAAGSGTRQVEQDLGDLPNISKADFLEITDEWAALFANPDKYVATSKRVKDMPFLTLEEAQKRVDEWRNEALRQGDEAAVRNSDKTILSLFDLTGDWARPWAEAGYNVILFDIQNGQDVMDFSTEYFADNYDFGEVYGILAACPCTDFANSGNRHKRQKHIDGRTEASKQLVFQTLRTIEYFRPKFWVLENPVGQIEELTGLPRARMSFDPNHFGDPYTKKTMLWGKFNTDLPLAPVEPTEGSKMHKKYGGSSQKTKNARSQTPLGFSYAFFMANNYEGLPVEERLVGDFPEISGAVKQALKAGMPERRIREIVEDPYGDYEFDDARAALAAAVSEFSSSIEGQLANTTDDDLSAMIDDLMAGDGAGVSPTVTPAPKTKRTRKPKAAAREMGQGGRPADGKPIQPGDTFRTLSGRTTTPYPKQKGEKYASQWLIVNAKAEAEARGDSFNATAFSGTTLLKGGQLAPADIDAMQMYLFEQQPGVPAPLLKPLAPKPLTEITLTRDIDGKPVERTADAWVQDIDNRITSMKQLFACVNSNAD